MRAHGIAILRQYDAPMVLGMISEKTRMSNVSMAEVMAKNWLPKMASLCAPTPAAPTVCEMVLSDNMAAMGLSMSCLYFLSRGAPLRPSFSSMDTNDIGAESSTASRIEHKNEMLKAPKR